MKIFSFDILFELKDKVTGKINVISKAFRDVAREAAAATGQSEKFGGVCNRLDFPKFAAIAEGVQNVADQLAAAAGTGMGFGQVMADLSSITGITGKELGQLEERARAVGSDSGLGADTAARAYSLLASQIEVADIGIEGLNTLLDKSVTLAHASGMSMDAAANALAGTVNQFGLGAGEAERIINVLAAGSKYGAAEIEDLSQSFKVVGSAASAMGLDVETTAGALEVLSKANLKGSEAGTALRNIILKLNTELGMDLGTVPLSDALASLSPRLTDAAYLSKVFGMENIAAAQFLVQHAAEVDEMTAKLTDTNTAQEQAATRTQTTAQRLAELRANMDNVKISITNALGSFAPWAAVLSENASTVVFVIQGAKGLLGIIAKLNAVVKLLTGSTIAHKAASMAVAAASKVWMGVQVALNAVLTANPIAMAVMAIGGLVAAAVTAYNRFEGFRKICNRVWEVVSELASVVWNTLVKAFERVSAVVQKAWKWVKNFFGISDSGSAKKASENIEAETKAIDRNTEAKKRNAKTGLPVVTGSEQPQAAVVPSPGSMAELEKRLSDLRERQKAAPVEMQLTYVADIVGLEGQIASLKTRLAREEFVVKYRITPEQQAGATAPIGGNEARGAGIGSALQGIDINKIKLPKDLTVPKTDGLDLTKPMGQMEQWNTLADDMRNRMDGTLAPMQAMSQGFGALGDAVGGNAGEWLTWGANVATAIGAALPQLATLVAAQTADAGTKAAGAVAGIPIVGPMLAVAAVAGILGAVASLPKFADGCLAYGPTLGIFGEYAGASNNPEVVAPLNKLRGMLVDVAGAPAAGGKVRFVIEGRTLVGILESENRRSFRS